MTSVLADVNLSAPTGGAFWPTLSKTTTTTTKNFPELVADFGAVINDTSSGARTANATALTNALAGSDYIVMLPQGTIHLPANANIDLPSSRQLVGRGQWSGTILSGDGNMFTITTAGGAESRTPLRNLQLQGENVDSTNSGSIIGVQLTADLGRVRFEQLNFQAAGHHVYQYQTSAGKFLVDWEFVDCKFQGSLWDSRYICAASALKDVRSNCTFNSRHLRLGDGSGGYGGVIESFSADGCIYEDSSLEGVYIVATGANVYDTHFSHCHFEGNGSTAGAASIALQTSSANSINQTTLIGCFMSSISGQPFHISQNIGGGGSIGDIDVAYSRIFGPAALADNTTNVFVNKNNYTSTSEAANWKKATYA